MQIALLVQLHYLYLKICYIISKLQKLTLPNKTNQADTLKLPTGKEPKLLIGNDCQ